MAFEYESQLAVTDYRMIIRELNKIEPSLSRGFKKNFKSHLFRWLFLWL